MPIMCNTGDWFTLRPGNTYRKFELYSLDLPIDIDLEFMNVIGAPFGGPIAITKFYDKSNPTKNVYKSIIQIFSASGKLISTITWKHGELLTMGWSDTEELVCVQDDGLVVIYDMFGTQKHTFSMGQEATYTKVIQAKIFSSMAGTGIAIMTTNYRFFLINNICKPTNRQLPEIPKSVSNPTCWEIVNEDRNTYCLVAHEKEIIKLVQGDNVCTILCPTFDKSFKNIIKISISFNHRNLAFLTNNGILWLGTIEMEKLCEFDTGKISEIPKQIEWILDSETCYDSDAVVLTYPSLLLVININGDQNMYVYDPAIFLIPEIDGVRILTNTSHEIIQKVPSCVQNIFAINSQEPSSFLFEAQKKFEDKSHQSDEYLSLIKDKFDIAVDECIQAAGYEFDPETQKSLIKAAYFGKGFIPSHNPDKYIEMCRTLRVLNALRAPKIGLPLTYNQFQHLQARVVIDRLVFRKFYGIAIQIAKYLKLPESRILEHWAFHKIIYDKNDKDVANKIIEKFKNSAIQGISFHNIAEKAHNVGRNDLAVKLLELEDNASLQVPLLLKLEQNEKALYSATKSGDTDLIYMVLLHLQKTMQLTKFQMILQDFDTAHNLYKKFCQSYSKNALQNLYNLEDDFLSQAIFSLRESFESSNIEASLPVAAVAYTKAGKDIESELCSETRKLFKHQKTFSEKYKSLHGIEFYGLSVNETLKSLLTIGDLKVAEKFKSEYKISDKSYWWFRIEILSKQHKWDELDKFSKSKKSPIDYEPFVEVCLKENNIQEAKRYLPRCRSDKKAKWYFRAGLLSEAAAIAFEHKDLSMLYTIHMSANKSGDNFLIPSIENFIAQLSTKK